MKPIYEPKGAAKEYGDFVLNMAQVLPNLDELIARVKIDKVEITVTIEPERTEISVQPWKPYTPVCPFAAPKEGEHGLR